VNTTGEECRQILTRFVTNPSRQMLHERDASQRSKGHSGLSRSRYVTEALTGNASREILPTSETNSDTTVHQLIAPPLDGWCKPKAHRPTPTTQPVTTRPAGTGPGTHIAWWCPDRM